MLRLGECGGWGDEFLSPVECCVLVCLLVFVFCFLCVFFFLLITSMCILFICCITQSYRVHLIIYLIDAMLYPLKYIYLDKYG